MVYVTLLQDVLPLGHHTFRGLSTTHGRVVSVRFFRNSPRYNPFYEQYNYSVWLLRTTVHNVMRTITYNHPQRYANNYVQPSTTLCEQLRTIAHNVRRPFFGCPKSRRAIQGVATLYCDCHYYVANSRKVINILPVSTKHQGIDECLCDNVTYPEIS